MGIYIKGFHMPTSCGKCAFKKFISWGRLDNETGYVCLANENIKFAGPYAVRNPDCPLIPVPPHGRLIDLDYADDYAYDELELANSYLTGWEAARAMQKIYQNAPTIIPAEESEDG